MIRERVESAIRSPWFDRGCYAVIVILSGVFIYLKITKEEPSDNEINMSCFAFRDENRNGIFDMGDRPFAGLEVLMTRPRGDVVASYSNLGGFTNFKMRRHQKDAEIHQPGTYQFQVQVPEGWLLTTDNLRQSFAIRDLEGSPADLAADNTLSLVGVAPVLSISGAIKNGGGLGQVVEAVGPGGAVRKVELSDSGAFSFAAEAGLWTVRSNLPEGSLVERPVIVGNYPVVLSSSWEAFERRWAEEPLRVIHFEAFGPNSQIEEIPNGYQGLSWRNWVATHHKFYQKAEHVNAAISGAYIAYTSSGHPADLTAAEPFDLLGLFVSMQAKGAQTGRAVMRGWRNGELIYEDRVTMQAVGPLFFQADYKGIDRFQVSHETYWNVYIDDVMIRSH